MITISAFIIGALMRRIWGGWLSIEHYLKIGLAIILFGFFGWMTHPNFVHFDRTIIAITSLLMGLSFLNPYNNEYMRFGNDPLPPPIYNPTFEECWIAHATSTALIPMICASIAVFLGKPIHVLLLPIYIMALNPLGYILGWWLDKKNIRPIVPLFGTLFIDGATTIGELWLGGIMYSGYTLFL